MCSMHTRTKQEKDKGKSAWYMNMTSQRTIEGRSRNLQKGVPRNTMRNATWYNSEKDILIYDERQVSSGKDAGMQ